jgi:hypothetical protein
MPDLAKKIDGLKYMWDGEEYADKGAAEEVVNKYKGDNFEIQLIEEDGKFLVYTRREAEAVVEGEAPV